MSMRIKEFCHSAWSALRAVLGDDAYERYLKHAREHHVGSKPMDRTQFYRSELDRRWSQINRCC